MRIGMVGACLASLGFALSGSGALSADLKTTPAARVEVARAAVESAKSIAKAGRGALLMAGSVLSTADAADGNVLAVVDYPEIAAMQPGMVLLLAKRNCEPIEKCLIARRVIGHDTEGMVQTESLGTAEPFLMDQIQATLLGSVAYAVDLETGEIRDMHVDRRTERLTSEEAIARERARYDSARRLSARGN